MASMEAERLPDGRLRVPRTFIGPNGEIGEGMATIGPDDPGYEEWAGWISYLKGCRASVGWLGPVQPGARRVDLDGAAAPRRTAHRDRPTEPQVTASAAPELVIVGGAELDVAPADLAGPDHRIHSYPG